MKCPHKNVAIKAGEFHICLDCKEDLKPFIERRRSYVEG